MNLYLTADQIGSPTGGGVVTYHESEALKSLGPCDVVDYHWLLRKKAEGTFVPKAQIAEPWYSDAIVRTSYDWDVKPPKLAHIYAGTFSTSIDRMQRYETKITYTAAAHDIDESRQEHEKLGIPFDYRHLNDPEQWRRYVAGYLAADVVVCPSEHSAACMRRFGAKNITVIPHGVSLPDLSNPAPAPATFTVGYLGSYGPDKGVRYLLEAWKKLNYRDAVLLLGGRDSTGPWVRHLVQTYGGGNVHCLGWVKDVSTFYDRLSLYVQPSVTEGFGIEVLEAMAHGRPVLCSTGAGAADVLPKGDWEIDRYTFPPTDVEALSQVIHTRRQSTSYADSWRILAERYTWDKIRQRYVDLWKGLLDAP
jgi:glycosyltransferase involved in cell wall biosynthesis